MKTLIINGSPRKDGDTAALVGQLRRNLKGDVLEISDSSAIRPCIDCRYCRENPGCAIDDYMQEVYRCIAECDNVVLASPVWFSSLAGPLLNIASRLQTLWCARHFRGEIPDIRPKNGAIILVGAQKGTETGPEAVALTIMGNMNVRRKEVIRVYSMDTDNVPAALDAEAMDRAEWAAQRMNESCKEPAK